MSTGRDPAFVLIDKTREYSGIAGEQVRVEMEGDKVTYVFGSELAMLRIYYRQKGGFVGKTEHMFFYKP